jgi:hypothetical protein
MDPHQGSLQKPVSKPSLIFTYLPSRYNSLTLSKSGISRLVFQLSYPSLDYVLFPHNFATDNLCIQISTTIYITNLHPSSSSPLLRGLFFLALIS